MSCLALCQQWTTSPTNCWKKRSQTGDLRGNSGPSERDLVLLWYCGATYKSKNMDAEDDDFSMLILPLCCTIVIVKKQTHSPGLWHTARKRIQLQQTWTICCHILYITCNQCSLLSSEISTKLSNHSQWRALKLRRDCSTWILWWQRLKTSAADGRGQRYVVVLYMEL